MIHLVFDYMPISLNLKNIKSLAAVPLFTLKICRFFVCPALKGRMQNELRSRIRIRAKSIWIDNTAILNWDQIRKNSFSSPLVKEFYFSSLSRYLSFKTIVVISLVWCSGLCGS
jgi:hypothetical protein